MTAYVIADVKVTDTAAYERYKALSPNAVTSNGGRFLSRGGETAVMEGDWRPNRIVILEFPDMAAARAFYDSPEYREARGARKGAADFNMIIVDGV